MKDLTFEFEFNCQDCQEKLDFQIEDVIAGTIQTKVCISIKPCQRCLQYVQEQGYNKGRYDGFREGRDDGMELGFEKGYEQGLSESKKEGGN
jgi:flagellar biosynthesis/type III secretory pathway protein FliH